MELLGRALLAATVTGVALTGGAVLGVGMLLPWLAPTRAARHAVGTGVRRAACHGAWWLLALVAVVAWLDGAGAYLAGALPPLATVPLAVGMLGVAIRWWAGTLRHVGWWLGAGSWLLAGVAVWALTGVLLGGVDATTSPVLFLVTVGAVLAVVVGHGLAYAARRFTGPPGDRARAWAGGGLLPLTTVVWAALPPAAAARVPVADAAGPAAAGCLLAVLLVGAVGAWWAARDASPPKADRR